LNEHAKGLDDLFVIELASVEPREPSQRLRAERSDYRSELVIEALAQSQILERRTVGKMRKVKLDDAVSLV